MRQFQHPPLARHPAIQPFSRDHYVGLVRARHLINAMGADAATRRRVVAEFIDAWNREIREHFEDEEEVLLPLTQPEDRRRLLEDHERLSELAHQVRDMRRRIAPDSTVLRQVGEELEQHIRWEERELFPRLQRELDADQLANLQRRTEVLEGRRARNSCRVTNSTSEKSAS
jgi:iron-sulfur cluster repair protein YtfE (RIC family)